MAAETAAGGSRQQLGSAEDGGWRQRAAAGGRNQPKIGETGEGRGGRTEGGWRCWTPASVLVEAASSGGAAGWQQGSGAGDRRRREKEEEEEKQRGLTGHRKQRGGKRFLG